MSGAIVGLLGANVLNGKKENVAVATIAAGNKVIGLYFSAHWCPPCRSFTPQLAQFYSAMKSSHPGQLEIVFVSSDQDEKQWAEYFAEMPWLALPFSDRAGKDNLAKKFGVTGIPKFVLIDSQSGAVIVDNARMSVVNDPTGSGFPWGP